MKSTEQLFRRTIQTEKISRIMNCISFEVDLRASKPELRRYFTQLFGMQPLACRTQIIRNRKIVRFIISSEAAEQLQALTSQSGMPTAGRSGISEEFR